MNFGLINIFQKLPIIQEILKYAGSLFLLYLAYKISFSKSDPNNKNDNPAPVIDMLGLTESINVFIGVPTDPFSSNPWVKYPHPLTYVALLNSPNDLTPVENPVPGKEYLLFYVNLMTLDYVEAIIPGDFVLASEKENSIETALGKRNISQAGFIYSRRAEQNEGFKIREGCG